ncbi:MAG: ECF transporter S component [Clostridia bacterium]|nr:ECF transporter S component [Clostridia bacterium]
MKTRKLTVTALLAAIATVLTLLNFNIPIMPSFIKMDFSDLPALLAAFAFGPLSGIVVCLIKNIFNLFLSSGGLGGALSNFLLGVLFVTPAGWLYQRKKNRKGALVGSLIGAFTMALVGIFTNYYIVYPIYTAFLPLDTIIKMYQAINPYVTDLWTALIYMNFPFTLAKGLLNVALAFLVYKRLSPILHGYK